MHTFCGCVVTINVNGKTHNKFMTASGSEERGLDSQLQRLNKKYFNFLINQCKHSNNYQFGQRGE